MKELLALTLTVATIAVLPAVAEVDPKIHKLCVEAKDYSGCVRSMSRETSNTFTINQGANIANGNSCPKRFAYIGSGNCQQVSCTYGYGRNRHDQTVAGLKDANGKDVWGCKKWGLTTGILTLINGKITRTSIDKNCPEGEPVVGFNNTCQTEKIN